MSSVQRTENGNYVTRHGHITRKSKSTKSSKAVISGPTARRQYQIALASKTNDDETLCIMGHSEYANINY